MKKILMVSDYITNIGGIENYIHNSAELLRSQGDEVRFLGLDSDWLRNKRFRQLLLPFTACNIYISIRLIWVYLFWQPDIIYFHSVTRFVWRLPILIAWHMHADKMIMYHDLWFISPYPSRITDIHSLPKSWNFAEFRESNYPDYIYIQQKTWSAKLRYIYIRGILWLKFWSISLWRFFAIRYISKHLVPSPFMSSVLQNWWIKKQSIFVLWHFGNKA